MSWEGKSANLFEFLMSSWRLLTSLPGLLLRGRAARGDVRRPHVACAIDAAALQALDSLLHAAEQLLEHGASQRRGLVVGRADARLFRLSRHGRQKCARLGRKAKQEC